jgi:hypothetical protein
MVEDGDGRGSGRGPFKGTMTALTAKANSVRTVGVPTGIRTEPLQVKCGFSWARLLGHIAVLQEASSYCDFIIIQRLYINW